MGFFKSILQKNKTIGIAVIVLAGVFFVLQSKQRLVSLNTATFPSEGARSLDAPNMAGMVYDEKIAPPYEYSPEGNVSNRLTVQNSYLSLLVDDVANVRKEIVSYVQSIGGYMVSSDVSGGQESPSATVTVRIPQVQLDAVLAVFRAYSIRVVSEHLEGYDVTDQYVDIQKRIDILEKTIAQFEDLREKSQEISDLTAVTREILNIQSQIDSYKGQQDSLEKQAQFSKVTVYLSTDEIALPYQPDNNFRPTVIAKLAVRSVMSTVYSVLTFGIWVAVYGVIWIPLLIVGIIVYKRTKK